MVQIVQRKIDGWFTHDEEMRLFGNERGFPCLVVNEWRVGEQREEMDWIELKKKIWRLFTGRSSKNTLPCILSKSTTIKVYVKLHGIEYLASNFSYDDFVEIPVEKRNLRELQLIVPFEGAWVKRTFIAFDRIGEEIENFDQALGRPFNCWLDFRVEKGFPLGRLDFLNQYGFNKPKDRFTLKSMGYGGLDDASVVFERGVAHLVFGEGQCKMCDLSPWTIVGANFSDVLEPTSMVSVTGNLLLQKLLSVVCGIVGKFENYITSDGFLCAEVVEKLTNLFGNVGFDTFGHVLSDIVGALMSGIHYGLPGGLLVFKMLNLWIADRQKVQQSVNSVRVTDSVRVLRLEQFTEVEIETILAAHPFPQLGARDFFFSVDPALVAGRNYLKQFADDTVAQRNLATIASQMIVNANANDNRPRMYLGTDVTEALLPMMQRVFPEFRIRQTAMRHTHSILQAVRYAFGSLMQSEVRKMGDVVVKLVGPKAYQTMKYDHVYHACMPVLTGRDEARMREITHEQVDFVAKISCCDKFQHCRVTHKFKPTVVISEYSTGDMSLLDFVQGMLLSGASEAMLSICLPVPFLDERIQVYRDPINSLIYERRGKRILVYHSNGAVPGYDHDAVNLMSFCSSPPLIPGLSIKVEEYRRLGSNYLLKIQIGLGEQEMQPTIWKASDDPFYILPLLSPNWRKKDSLKRSFLVPATRFDNLVQFISAPGTDKDAYEVLCSRTRAQIAEIKLGSHVIEQRWQLGQEEFNSVIGHAIMAAKLSKRDYVDGFKRYASYYNKHYDRFGESILLRLKTYYRQLFSLSLVGERDPYENSIWDSFWDWWTGVRLYKKEMQDPYVPVHEFRVVAEYKPEWYTFLLFEGVQVWCTHYQQLSGYGRYLNSVKNDSYWVLKVAGSEYKRDWLFRSRKKRTIKFEIPLGFGVLNAAGICEKVKEIANQPWCEEMHVEEQKFQFLATTKFVEDIDLQIPTNIAEETLVVSYGDGPVTVGVVGDDGDEDSIDERTDAERNVVEPQRGGPDLSGRELIVVQDDFIGDSFTASQFMPDEFPDLIEVSGESLCQSKFREMITDMADVVNLRDGVEIYCPDKGGALVVEQFLQRQVREWSPTGDVTVSAAILELHRNVDSSMDKMIVEFFTQIDVEHPATVPSLVLDGVAGSAKSSMVRSVIRRSRQVVTVVVPTRALRKEWGDKVDKRQVNVVTKHSKWRKCSILVVDECFAIEGEVLVTWMQLAKKNNAKVILIGERNQQYEHALHVNVDFFLNTLRANVMRCMVSNTMPMDAVAVAKSLLQKEDLSIHLMQTRNPRRHSMYWIQEGDPLADRTWHDLEFSETSKCTYLGPREASEDIPGISQIQGFRVRRALFHPSLSGVTWLRETPKLAYVAISRHSELWISYYSTANMEYSLFCESERTNIVDGVKRISHPFSLDDVERIHYDERAWMIPGGEPYAIQFEKKNNYASDWLPNPLIAIEEIGVMEVQDLIYSRTMLPSAMRDDLPQHLKAGVGLRSFAMHPKFKIEDTARVRLMNAEGLAVHQYSGNHWDDLRNIDLRQFDKDVNPDWSDKIVRDASFLFDLFVQSYFKEDFSVRLEQPNTVRWLHTRSTQFLHMLTMPQIFGFDAKTMGHQGFLKTQDKVKAKPNYQAELQYGQTVIASHSSYNALMGPHTQRFEKRLQAALRDDYLMDVGYSDRDLQRLLQERHLFESLTNDPYQVDVKRQDSSHNVQAVIAFAMMIEYLGFDPSLAELYIHKRSLFRVNSMVPCLYNGTLSFTLPSGDPWTLTANIFQMMLTACERFDMRNISGMTKGDDSLWDVKPKPREGHPIAAMRSVVFEELGNGVAYHAGRFLLFNGSLVYDPVRFVLKMLARGQTKATNEELYVALVDRLMWLDDENKRILPYLINKQYSDITLPEAVQIIRIADSLKNGKLYWKLVNKTISLKREVRFSADSDCAFELALWLGANEEQAELFRYTTPKTCADLFRKFFPKHSTFMVGDVIGRKIWLKGGIVVKKDHVMFIY